LTIDTALCPYCGTHFTVSTKGTCQNCHQITAATPSGNCAQCGTKLTDLQSELRIVPTIGASQSLVANRSVPKQPAGEARIYCAKCKSENPPTAVHCQNCNANLLPGEGVIERIVFFFGFLFFAALCGYLLYHFYVQDPGSAPDVPFLNPIVLGILTFIFLLMAIVYPLRKTPLYTRYADRANRHLNLNPWQSLNDLNSAMDIAPEKQHELLKKRAKLHEKLGLAEDAARDQLALVTSPKAYKEAGDWVAGFTGVDADTFSKNMRSGQIKTLLSSGKAVAVGYCPKCRSVVQLNKEQRCPVHPKKKGKEVEVVIPVDLLVGKLAVLQKMERGKPQLTAEIETLLNSGQVEALGYCKRCHCVVNLDPGRHCRIHPKISGQDIKYVLPGREKDAKRSIMQVHRYDQAIAMKRIVFIVAFFALVLAAFIIFFPEAIDEFILRLSGK